MEKDVQSFKGLIVLFPLQIYKNVLKWYCMQGWWNGRHATLRG